VTVSLCAIVLDEELLLPAMLRGVVDLVDELVVGVDDRTTDTTDAILASAGAHVARFTWADDFAAARNSVLERATGDWILALDADERLTPGGIAIIRDLLSSPAMTEMNGYCFQMLEVDLEGNPHTDHPTVPRLFERRADLRYRGVVHEEPVLLSAPGAARWCLVPEPFGMIHVGYDPRLWIGRKKHERNVRLLERRLREDPTDEYARRKLDQEMAMGESGVVQPR
jgi:glycosyltransferase involved in cell wall biosynthesis